MLSRRKRLAFIAVVVVGVVAVTELASIVGIWFVHGSISRLAKHRQHILDQDPAAPFRQRTLPGMIHPYIGSVVQPKNDGGQLTIAGKFRVTEFGFMDDAPPIHRRAPDRVIVAILGGSVARQMTMNAGPVLEQELRKSPRFAGKSFRFVRLAVDGFKQPQQLMTINYLMSLGAEFDVVINLDGVNESALAKMDNVPFGVAAANPRKWNLYASQEITARFGSPISRQMPTPSTDQTRGQFLGTVLLISAAGNLRITRMVGLVTYLRERQCDNAIAFGSFPWKYSSTCGLLWSICNGRLEQSIRQQSDVISKVAAEELSYCVSGPPEKFDSDQLLFEHCIDVWYRSSVLLHAICHQHGAQYFHFLQPNQYLPNSKPIGSQEAKLAINEDSEFRIPVQQCYPIMRSKAESLRSAAVAFTDLTQLFADHPEELYVDDCCHLNPTGDEILATAIAAQIVKQLDSNR